MHNIILANGNGTKMWPYNINNKSSLPIGNTTIIERLIIQSKNNNLKPIIVINEKDHYLNNILSGIKDVEVIKLKDSLGTANTLLQTLKKVNIEKQYIVTYGDILVHDDDFNNFCNEKPSDILISISDPTGEMQETFGLNTKDKNLKIVGQPRSENYANKSIVGLFKINVDITNLLENNPNTFKNVPTGVNPPHEFFLEQTINDATFSKKILITEHQTIDIDKPWHLMVAAQLYGKWWFKKNNNYIAKTAKIHSDVEIPKNIYIGDNVIIGKGAILGNGIFIGDNSYVIHGAKLHEGAQIGQKCKIGYCADIDGIVMNNSAIVHVAEVYGIIGEGVDLAAGTMFGSLKFNDTKTIQTINERKEIPKDYSAISCIGNYSRTGVGVSLLPGVMVGNGTAIFPNVLVTKNVPDNSLVILEQNTKTVKWGSKKYGW